MEFIFVCVFLTNPDVGLNIHIAAYCGLEPSKTGKILDDTDKPLNIFTLWLKTVIGWY